MFLPRDNASSTRTASEHTTGEDQGEGFHHWGLSSRDSWLIGISYSRPPPNHEVTPCWGQACRSPLSNAAVVAFQAMAALFFFDALPVFGLCSGRDYDVIGAMEP